VKQCHFEAANLNATVAFIRENNLVDEVDLVTCETADVYMSKKKWETQLKSLAEFRAAGGDTSKVRVHEGDDARKVGDYNAVIANLNPNRYQEFRAVLEQYPTQQQASGHIN